MTPTFRPLILLMTALVVGHPCTLLADSTAPTETTVIKSQLDAALKQQLEAQKQVALKKAAVDVEKKREADLQRQLAEAKQRSQGEAKALEVATQQQNATAQQVAALSESLQRHQHVDRLAATALAVSRQAAAARDKYKSLVDQAAALKQTALDQQQLESKAVSASQVAKEQLPKTTEELTKARAAFDVVAKELDVARLAVTTARTVVKEQQAAGQTERSRSLKAAAALVQVNASIKSLQDSLTTIQAAAKTADIDPQEAGAELTKSIAGVMPLQQRANELVAAANARIAAAEKQFAESNTALSAAQAKVREHQNTYAEHSRTHFKLQLALADLQSGEKLYQKQIADAKAQQEQLIVKQTEFEPQIAAALSEFEKVEADYVTKQRVAEAAMEPLGRFVSFSKHIAPIFAKRCVACHNTRTASGRLNMDSFAALAKGGESGAAFEGHEADSSLLLSMIEDGSMPKDADPLTEEEIALVKKWIQVGSPLDAGVIATADLFQVMPEMAQPLPPKTYRVPIPVTATAFNPDASILASSGYHEILLWNTADGNLLRRITNVAERVYDLKFSKDGTQLAVAAGTPGQLGEVKIFSTADGKHLQTLVRTKDAIFAVAFSPDESHVAAGGADRIVYVVEVSSAKTVLQIEDHADWVMDVSWSPDSKQLVSSSRDKTVKVFDAVSGDSVTTFSGHGDAVYTAAFLADGKSVVSAGSDRQARVWNVADAKEVRKIGGFGSDIFRLTVTPENHLLTASADRNAREHNLADGEIVRTFAGHKDWVYTLCYNPGKKLIATGSYDGEIRVWNSEDGSVATSFIAIPKAGDNATVAAAEK
jgi:WD40 repeat protein